MNDVSGPRLFLAATCCSRSPEPALLLTAFQFTFSLPRPDQPPAGPAHLPPKTSLAAEDDQLLDDLEKANFQYFWEQASPETGLVKDRGSVRGSDQGTVGSIAAIGFGLTALCIAEKRGYIASKLARVRVISTLTSLWKKLPNHRGFFYHWANINTGERVWDAEVSSRRYRNPLVRSLNLPSAFSAARCHRTCQ